MGRVLAACATISIVLCFLDRAAEAEQWITYDGYDGPGNGKHIVLIAADDEYRSEESVPPLAKILAHRHGFKCTVLFAVNPGTGAIDPATLDNIPGLEVLDSADLVVLFLRFRALPDEQMKRIMVYTNSGRPLLALRTSTHAFSYRRDSGSPYAKWSWTSKDPKGGFGREVLGETWINHYGKHRVESTRGLIAPGMEEHPIVRGCEDIWGPSDVYGITKLSGDSQALVLGQVLSGMDPGDAPAADKKQLPVAWIKTYTGTSGRTGRIFTTTMGHPYDLKSEGFRRLVVNGAYWCLEMEDAIPERADVRLVGTYNPSGIGFGTPNVGVMPSDHALDAER